MTLTIFDLIIWGIIGWYVWKGIQKMRKGPGSGPSMTGEDGRPLTDTQVHYRQQQALMKLDTKHDDPLMDLFTSEQQNLIEASLYIQENIRPFHWYEWLMAPIDSRLVLRYSANMSGLFIAMVAVPLYFGWPVMTPILAAFVVFYDILMYRQQRLLEVTNWDSEFQRRFVKKN